MIAWFHPGLIYIAGAPFIPLLKGRLRKAYLLLLPCLALLAAAGCDTFDKMEGVQTVKAEYKPKNRKILIIPFSDAAFPYFESKEGRIVSNEVGDYLLRSKICVAKYDRLFTSSVQSLYAEKKTTDPRSIEAFKALAEVLDCDMVLLGQIEVYNVLSGKSTNVSHGDMVVSAQLYDLKENDTLVWQKQSMEVQFPERWENEFLPQADLPTPSLISHLLNRAGEKIGQCFHDHKEAL